MPKSYKITYVDKFAGENFTVEPFCLDQQKSIDGVPPPPQTQIYKARDEVTVEDFRKFIIVHEMEENAIGRINSQSFSRYIRQEKIGAFQSQNNNMLLLSGKKRFVIDFTRKTKELPDLKIRLANVNMAQLLAKLPSVRGVWFNFPKGLISASALMGNNLETTTDFEKFKTTGEISTLSFVYDFGGIGHPIMITTDGTVVLQSNYDEVSNEIILVLEIERKLLNDIIEKQPVA
jgi:hypothetical protein